MYTIPPAITPPPSMYRMSSEFRIASTPTTIANIETSTIKIEQLHITCNLFPLVIAKTSAIDVKNVKKKRVCGTTEVNQQSMKII
jgi:hypothetical protein